MLYEAVNLVILPVATRDAALAFEKLGLGLTGWMPVPAIGVERNQIAIGGGERPFQVELLRLVDRDVAAASAVGAAILPVIAEPGSVTAVMLRVQDMSEALADLASRGLAATAVEVQGSAGATLGEVALLPPSDVAAVRLLLVQYVDSSTRSAGALGNADQPTPALQIRRLDHLAALAPDLEASTRFWTDTLGIPVFGEVGSPTTRIRQFKIGDAIIELLGPATPDSPLHHRPPGLVSMVAVEVPDLEDAVTHARARGFTAPDAAAGVLPHTRTATIPASELSGMALQLLEYV